MEQPPSQSVWLLHPSLALLPSHQPYNPVKQKGQKQSKSKAEAQASQQGRDVDLT